MQAHLPTPPPNSKKPPKLSEQFKQQTKQRLLKQPPIYLISAIKDKNIYLDLDLIQADDINVISILFALPVLKIVLFCQEGKEGKKVNGQTPIYGSVKFREFFKCVGKAVEAGLLKSLHIQRVPLTVKHMLMLKQCIQKTQNLKQLSIRHCNLTDEHLQTLKSSLSKNQSLVILDLSFNKLQNSGSTIGKIMSQHSTRRDQLIWFASLRGQELEDDLSKKGICEVNLQGNQFNDKAVNQLINFLKNDQWSRCLNLKSNKIGVDGVREFAKLMKKNVSLISLDLRGNVGFTKQYSIYIIKKLKQNINKYKEQKKSYKRQQNQDPPQQTHQKQKQKQGKNTQHKSLSQSRRHRSQIKKDEITQQFTLNINNNNLTSVQKSYKHLSHPHQLQHQNQHQQQIRCKKCKSHIVEILKLQKHNLDLQFQLKKLKHVLLTRNIDLSAILPNTMHIDQQVSQVRPNNIVSSLNQFLSPCETDQDLLAKVQHIMMELTKIMDNIDVQQNTQIVNMSNNGLSNAHSLSNTIPLFAQNSELGELWESSIGGHVEDKDGREAKEVEKSGQMKEMREIGEIQEYKQMKQVKQMNQEVSWVREKGRQKEKKKRQRIISQRQIN